MRIRCRIEVACQPELLWSYLEDPQKLPRWMKGVTSFEPIGEGSRGPGSTARLFIKEGGKVGEYETRVVSWEPYEHLAIVMTGKNFGTTEMNVDYRLTDLGGRTRLDYLCTAEFPGLLMRVVTTLSSFMIKRQVAGFFATLKRLAEEEAGTALLSL